MWEDDQNKNGGRWIIKSPRPFKNLDKWWLEAVLCLVGEVFEYSEDIYGVVVTCRKKEDKIGMC